MTVWPITETCHSLYLFNLRLRVSVITTRLVWHKLPKQSASYSVTCYCAGRVEAGESSRDTNTPASCPYSTAVQLCWQRDELPFLPRWMTTQSWQKTQNQLWIPGEIIAWNNHIFGFSFHELNFQLKEKTYIPFHSSWKATKLLHETKAKVDLAQLEKWK